jgi:ribosomal protein S18 acetylase RimI-like enzyme
MDHILTSKLIENPSTAQIDRIRLNLQAFNNSFVQRKPRQTFAIHSHSEDGTFIGGLYAFIEWEWLHIELLWVDENFRGQYLGSRLINEIEERAIECGIHRFKVETASFQALNFYKKHGYEIAGTIKDLPPGHTNYYLTKTVTR